MKYCLKYTNICTKLYKADEISIKYIEDKGLVDFMKKFSSQRIILRVDPADFSHNEVRKLIAIRKQYPEYCFTIGLAYADPTLIPWFQQENIPFYVAAPCKSWEEFHWLMKQGVSDVDISGPLAFEIGNVRRVLNSLGRNVVVRATPNKVANLEHYTDTLVGFFIRPEDVVIYEDGIDVLEFEGLEHQDTFYSIYAEKDMFIGNLNQCIYGFQEQVDNKGLVTLFGERRKNCGRQCLNGGRCRRCYDLASLAKPMGDRARKTIMETIKKEQEKLRDEEE